MLPLAVAGTVGTLALAGGIVVFVFRLVRSARAAGPLPPAAEGRDDLWVDWDELFS